MGKLRRVDSSFPIYKSIWNNDRRGSPRRDVKLLGLINKTDVFCPYTFLSDNYKIIVYVTKMGDFLRDILVIYAMKKAYTYFMMIMV